MSLSLGLHNGHHASCAIVRDGVLVAGIEQERVTRLKNDGQEGLSNRLPIRECLNAAGATLRDIDVIVSSFQSSSPGGTGLHRPLIEANFDLFDPWDSRHLVISHHYAHGLSALGCSGFSDATVLVCDLAGSTTLDGRDFMSSFGVFEHELTSAPVQVETRTECLSVYEADACSFELKYREYCIPHNTPDVFVQNVASLYDNVARVIFGRDDAHGQLMALAALGAKTISSEVKAKQIINITSDGDVRFWNNWQHRITQQPDVLDYAPLAKEAQEALQCAILAYARKARGLTHSRNLVAAGGVFLNILANSQVLQSRLFEKYYVPSSPHDAGISIGCAYAGWRSTREKPRGAVRSKAVDRVGPIYDRWHVEEALQKKAHLIVVEKRVDPSAVACLLEKGQIIARCAGRSEFGPRALGGRSLLGSPLLGSVKTRLNAIKGRQEWRPVAPIVPRERLRLFFEGPDDSPYMNFVHSILVQYRDVLVALIHPDGSTRAQTIERPEDPYLYEVIGEFECLTGFPILVNTSLNGRGEPICETPEDALEFFRGSPDVDALLLDDFLIRHSQGPSWRDLRIAPDTIVNVIYPPGSKRIIMIRRGASLEISQDTLDLLERQQMNGVVSNQAQSLDQTGHVKAELAEAVRRGLLVTA
jgi:carbamoyltransferase